MDEKREMIKGVSVHPLKKSTDERGSVMHMLKKSDPHFEKFGEIYFSTVNPGAVKGWTRHKKMTLNFAVPSGTVKLVLFDERAGSPTKETIQEIILGEENYCLVKIPPMIWAGFKGLGKQPAILANCATMPHDPKEIERLDLSSSEIPYDWGKGKP